MKSLDTPHRLQSRMLPLLGLIGAALFVVPGARSASDPVGEASPMQRDGAFRQVLTRLVGDSSELAASSGATHRSLNIISRLLEKGQGAASVDLETMVLERANLDIARDALRGQLEKTFEIVEAEGDPGRLSTLRADAKTLDLSLRRISDLLRQAGEPRPGGPAGRRGELLLHLRGEVRRSLKLLSIDAVTTTRIVQEPMPEARLAPSAAVTATPSQPYAPASMPRASSAPQPAGLTQPASIQDLAQQLGFDPLRIYQHVRNNFRFELYPGLLKGSQATLETGGGNDYDLAALTGALLEASGKTIRYVRGTAIVPVQDVVAWLGLENASAANVILNTAGIPATPVLVNSVLDHYRVDRIWVEVQAPVRPGGDLAWFPLDTAFKRHDMRPGLDGMPALVPFNESGYLSATRTELTYEYYQQQVRDYLQLNNPGLSIADVPLGMSIVPEASASLPRSVPFQLFALGTTYSALPASVKHTARVRLRYQGIDQFSRDIVLPDASLSRLTLSYAVDPNDQSIVDSYGGLANTPAFLVDVIGRLKQDGVVVATAGTIPYLATVSLAVDFFRPGGSADGTSTHTLRAGEWAGIGIDAHQISDALLQRQADAIVSATQAEQSGGTPDPDDLIGALLYYEVMRHHMTVRIGEETSADLAHYRRIRGVSEGVAMATQQVLHLGGTAFTTLPGGLVLDVPRQIVSNFPLDNDNSDRATLLRVVGFNGSAQEHATWEELLNVPGVSTIKSLQLANERAVPVFIINNVDGNPSNDCSVLCPQLNLAASTESAIVSDAGAGRVVTVPRDPTPLNDWEGVGYLSEDPATGAAAYIISGGLNSALSDDPLVPHPSWDTRGGAVTIILSDGTILVVPAGRLGDGPGTAHTGDPVNIANGNFFREETDFALPALGEGLGFLRVYNSQSTYNGSLGLGWAHNYSERLAPQPNGSVIWIDDRGTASTFQPGVLPGTFVSPPGLRQTLLSTGGGFTLSAHTGVVRTYDAGGLLLSRADRNGNTYTMSYDGSSRLSTATDPNGRALTFAYNGANRISTVGDFSGRAWTYGYDVNGRLASVTSPSDAQTLPMITQYAYDAAGRMATITEPNGGIRGIHYYANGRVAQVTDPLGYPMTLVYNPFKSETSVTDARGLTEVHGFNASGNETSLKHADGAVERWTWANNRILTHTDPLGHIVTFTYDPSGNRSSAQDGSGLVTQFTYEAPFSNLKTVVRPGPVQMTYSYDGSGNLSQTLDPNGGTRILVNNARGLPQSITDARSHVVTYTYNGAGQVLTRTTQLPSTEISEYDPRGTLKRFTDGNSHVTAYTYDLLDRQLTVTDAQTNVARREYDAGGRLSRTIDPRGGQTRYFYDLNDRLIKQIYPDNSAFRFEYDQVGNQITFVDALGKITRQEYDNRNRPVKVIRPDGSILRTTYDAAGRVASQVDPLGHVTRFEYDGAGRLTRTIDPALNETLRSYDGNGRLVSITEAGLANTTLEYDALDRLTEIRGEGGRVETLDYDRNGNVVEKTRYDVSGLGSIPADPRTLPASRKRTISSTYDVLDRLETTTTPETGVITHVYDSSRNILSITDTRGKATTFEYDGVDRPIKVTRPDTGRLDYGYDAAGNMTSLKLPAGGVYGWTYDALNRPQTMTDPLGREMGYVYDATGKIVIQTNADGTWVRNSYDGLGRTRHVARSDGSFEDKLYDLAGNLTQAATERTKLVFAYDSRNLRTSETLSIDGAVVGGPVAYTWDAGLNLATATDPAGRVVTYGRDPAHRLTSVTDNQAGPTLGIAYNGWGERRTLTYGNGTAGVIDYDKNGRATRIDWTDAIARFDYTRDPAGNPTQISEALGGALETLNLVYDDLSRPTSATAAGSPATRSETFAYGLDGNLTNPGTAAPVTFNLADQAIADGLGRSFTYDLQGNRTARVDPGGTRLETPHDPANRYTALRSLSSGVTTRDLRLTYDALHRLVEIKEGSTVRRFVHAMGNPLVEYDAAGAATFLYSSGPGTDDHFGFRSSGSNKYLHRDYVGSVRAVTSSAGAFVGGRNFGQFGRLQSVAGTPGTDLGFAGHYFDVTTGLVYARARLYDPALGSFLARDPLGFENILTSHNPSVYSWAGNRPGLFVDPLGLSPEPPWWRQALDNAGLFFKGAGEAAWDFAYETLATTYDLEQVIWYSATGDLNGFQATSAIGKSAEGGAGTGDILWATAQGVVKIPWEWGQSLVSGDPERIGRATFNFELALYAAGRGELNAPINGVPVINNPIPGTLARVIPGEGPFTTLGRPGAVDVFVTAADDIAGMSASQIPGRVTIPGSTVYTIIEFPTPSSGLASPVFRLDPGFVGRGLTAGGAREFVLPNGPIPPGAVIRVIGR